ncbi:MAG: PDZ domain-containing protein [Planctomycetes bacterium]|nr:PDZ domain-containing protein [Planctomycetota bacterium]
MRCALLILGLACGALAAGEATTPPATAPGATAPAPAPKAYLGVAIDPAATAFDGKGLAILRVEPSSPAAVMGLAAGDRLLSMDGKALKNQDELAAIISAHKPGDTVQIEAMRPQGKDGLPQTLKLSGVLQDTPRSRVGSLGSQLSELQGRIAELSGKTKEPTLAEVLQRLQEIERDLPKAAEEFKRVYPKGEFRIAISVEITSDKSAKDPLDIDVGSKPADAVKPEAAPAPVETPKTPVETPKP